MFCNDDEHSILCGRDIEYSIISSSVTHFRGTGVCNLYFQEQYMPPLDKIYLETQNLLTLKR